MLEEGNLAMAAIDCLRLGAEAYVAELSREELARLLRLTHPDLRMEMNLGDQSHQLAL